MKKAIKNELEAIYMDKGALDPGDVVEVARSADSALHDHFNWNDSEAAHQHRLNQARQLIRVAVTVIPAISNKLVRQFISVSSLRGTGTGSYIATVDVLSDEERRAQVLADAITALQGIEKRYRYLHELQPVFDALASLSMNSEAA